MKSPTNHNRSLATPSETPLSVIVWVAEGFLQINGSELGRGGQSRSLHKSRDPVAQDNPQTFHAGTTFSLVERKSLW